MMFLTKNKKQKYGERKIQQVSSFVLFLGSLSAHFEGLMHMDLLAFI